MDDFRGAAIGFWFDCGHAHAQACLGMAPEAAWLERFGSQTVGAHLHDAVGPRDHLVPGRGEVDWAAVLKALPHGIPLVVELAPDTADADVTAGIEWLERRAAANKAQPDAG